jgi:uncharacterized membrane protein
MFKTAKSFFTLEEQQRIVEAIREAEKNTSGEIRVHIDNFCFGSVVKKAQKLFQKLGMFQTNDRNGILIYIATLSHKIAVVGDEGIHQKLGAEYWDSIVKEIVDAFAHHKKADGLTKGIINCGHQLKIYFPYQSGDKNELNDSISF